MAYVCGYERRCLYVCKIQVLRIIKRKKLDKISSFFVFLDVVTGFGAFTHNRIENSFAEAQGFGGDFQQFVFLYIRQALFQRQFPRRNEVNCLVFAGGSDVGQLFGLTRIDFQIVRFGVFTDNHTDINGNAGINKHRTAVLQFPQGVSDGGSAFGGNQNTVAAAFDLAVIRFIALKEAVHYAGAAGVGQKFRMVSD